MMSPVWLNCCRLKYLALWHASHTDNDFLTGIYLVYLTLFFPCPFNILKHPAKYPHWLAPLQEQKCCSKPFSVEWVFTHTHTHAHIHTHTRTHTYYIQRERRKGCTFFMVMVMQQRKRKGRGEKNGVHQILNSQVLVWETWVLTFTPQSYPTDGDAVRVISPLITSHNSLVAPVICNIIVLISKRGVAHTLDTYDPYVPLFNDARNLHIKFHLNTLCRSVHQAPK